MSCRFPVTGEHTCWEAIHSRMNTAKFKTRKTDVKINVVQCCAPTNDADDER